MDELDVRELFHVELNAVLGTNGARSFEREAFVRRMSRKLSQHFDVIGWPASKDEVRAYVKDAIERYC